jgi:hypothetical protein
LLVTSAGDVLVLVSSGATRRLDSNGKEKPGGQAFNGVLSNGLFDAPKCPDACSSFVHWDHRFPSCPGGDANHSDYWLWFDDKLPGNAGAAAVGGDWGLRMPVSTFLRAFNNASASICEHEMGHGFGIHREKRFKKSHAKSVLT